jgi:hypothetical protein
LLTLTACDSILGISRAKVDPTLDVSQAGTGGGGNGVAGTAGANAGTSAAGGNAGTTAAGGNGATGGASGEAGTGGAAGGGMAGASGMGGGAAGAAGSPAVDPCVTYCDTIAQSCTGLNAEYISREVCLAMCGTFDPGQPGDQTNDSLACRMRHATLAATDPLVHCQQAGPLAAGECADPCGPFCILAYNLCNPAGLFPYKDGVKACRTACAAFPYLKSSDPANTEPVGDIIFLGGDTLNCRLYHLESAYNPGDPNAIKVHCGHTAVDSATCN